MNLFNYKYRLKFQLAMNDVYFLCLRQHVTLKIGGGGGGGGVRPWLRNIAVRVGWVLITVDYGEG